MAENELDRIKGDLAIMQRAMGLHLSYGRGMLVFGILLTVTAVGAAVVSLLVENNWLQVASFATLMALCLLGLYLQSHRTADLSHEIKLQVGLSITIYFAVFGAACGYTLAAFCGPTIGAARTAALYAASLAYVLPFSFILVLNALKNRERHYCLGLAASLLLTGLIIPILDPHYSFPLAHGFMAVGYLMGVAIQWFQLREAETHHATD
jgi:carbon starvation protein CstA